MRRYADMRENGVEKFASPLLIEALELEPPPLLRQHLPRTTTPSPQENIRVQASLPVLWTILFYIRFVCVWGGGGAAVCVSQFDSG